MSTALLLAAAPAGTDPASALGLGETLRDAEGERPLGDVGGGGWIADREAGPGTSVDLAAAANGTLWMAMESPSPLNVTYNTSVALAWSNDSGDTWTRVAVFGGNATDPPYLTPSLGVDLVTGKFYLALQDAAAQDVWVVHGRPDWGWNWSLLPDGGYSVSDPDLVVQYDNGTGNGVYLVWRVLTASPEIDLGFSYDNGTTWGRARVDGYTSSTPISQPAVAYGNGTLWASYRYGTTDIRSMTTPVPPTVDATPDCTSCLIRGVITGGFGLTREDPDVAVTRNGAVGVVVFSQNAQNIFARYSLDQGNSWGFVSYGVANLAGAEHTPSLTVDGMESTSNATGGWFHVGYLLDNGTSLSAWYAKVDSSIRGVWTGNVRVSDGGRWVQGTSLDATAATVQRRGIANYTDHPVVGFLGLNATGNVTVYATTAGGWLSIDTSPPGFLVSVDGVNYTAPFARSYPSGALHVVDVPSPQGEIANLSRRGFSSWTSGSAQAHPFYSEFGDLVETAVLAREWWVQIATDPPGYEFLVDGVNTTAYADWWVENATHFVDVVTPQNVSADTRLVFSNWSDGRPRLHDASVANATVLTAYLTYEYWTVVDTAPTNRTVLVDGANATTPSGFWWVAGSGHDVEAYATLPIDADTRLGFANWSDGGNRSHVHTVAGPATLVSNHVEEHLVTVDTAPSGLWFSADGIPANSSQTYWWVNGSVHTLNLTSPQGSADDWHEFTGWSDGDPSADRAYTVTAPADLVASFDRYYRATVSTSPDGLEFWVDATWYNATTTLAWKEGTGHTVNTSSPQPGPPGVRYALGSWSDGGAQSHVATSTGPLDLVASFVTQYNVTVDTTPANFVVAVDGVWYRAPAWFWWDAGSNHTIFGNASQGSFLFASWSDGGNRSHNVTASTPTTLLATYTPAPILVLTATASVSSGILPLTVVFNASAVGGVPPYTWRWDFDDGSVATVPNVTHVFPDAGTYDVTVRVTDAVGVFTTRTLPILVSPPPPRLDRCTVTPFAVSLDPGDRQQFTAHGWNGSTELVGFGVAWSVSGGVGSVDGSGLFTASIPGLGSVDAVLTLAGDVQGCSAAVYVLAPLPLPVVAFSTPKPGAVLPDPDVAVTGTASGADSVEVRAEGGSWIMATGTDVWSAVVDVRGWPNGPLVLQARGINGSYVSIPVTVSVELAVPPPPTVAVDSPADGAVITATLLPLSGTSANANLVQVRIGGASWTDASGLAAWTASLDIGTLPDGPFTVEARALRSGLEAVERLGLTKVTPRPPSVSILVPATGTTVSEPTLSVLGTSSDASLVQVRVEVGAWQNASGLSPWSLPLDLGALANGNWRVEARALNGSLEATAFVFIALSVLPVLTVDAPAEGATLKGIVTFRGSATPGTYVHFRVTGAWRIIEVLEDGNWSYPFDAGTLENGQYVIQFKAVRSGLESPVVHRVVVVDNPGSPLAPVAGAPWLVPLLIAIVAAGIVLFIYYRRRRAKVTVVEEEIEAGPRPATLAPPAKASPAEAKGPAKEPAAKPAAAPAGKEPLAAPAAASKPAPAEPAPAASLASILAKPETRPAPAKAPEKPPAPAPVSPKPATPAAPSAAPTAAPTPAAASPQPVRPRPKTAVAPATPPKPAPAAPPPAAAVPPPAPATGVEGPKPAAAPAPAAPPPPTPGEKPAAETKPRPRKKAAAKPAAKPAAPAKKREKPKG